MSHESEVKFFQALEDLSRKFQTFSTNMGNLFKIALSNVDERLLKLERRDNRSCGEASTAAAFTTKLARMGLSVQVHFDITTRTTTAQLVRVSPTSPFNPYKSQLANITVSTVCDDKDVLSASRGAKIALMKLRSVIASRVVGYEKLQVRRAESMVEVMMRCLR